jgi:uncharacterized membrane-anchored protein YjiN (DUF445 family)
MKDFDKGIKAIIEESRILQKHLTIFDPIHSLYEEIYRITQSKIKAKLLKPLDEKIDKIENRLFETSVFIDILQNIGLSYRRFLEKSCEKNSSLIFIAEQTKVALKSLYQVYGLIIS